MNYTSSESFHTLLHWQSNGSGKQWVIPWAGTVGDVIPWAGTFGDVIPWPGKVGDVIPWPGTAGDVIPWASEESST